MKTLFIGFLLLSSIPAFSKNGVVCKASLYGSDSIQIMEKEIKTVRVDDGQIFLKQEQIGNYTVNYSIHTYDNSGTMSFNIYNTKNAILSAFARTSLNAIKKQRFTTTPVLSLGLSKESVSIYCEVK
jgi:hypothetical protein